MYATAIAARAVVVGGTSSWGGGVVQASVQRHRQRTSADSVLLIIVCRPKVDMAKGDFILRGSNWKAIPEISTSSYTSGVPKESFFAGCYRGWVNFPVRLSCTLLTASLVADVFEAKAADVI